MKYYNDKIYSELEGYTMFCRFVKTNTVNNIINDTLYFCAVVTLFKT